MDEENDDQDMYASDSSDSTVSCPRQKKAKLFGDSYGKFRREFEAKYGKLNKAELKNVIRDLTKECEEFSLPEETDTDKLFEDMYLNINKGKVISNMIKKGSCNIQEQYMAGLHTRAFILAFRLKTEKYGRGKTSSIFSLDHLINSVKNLYYNSEKEEFVTEDAQRALSWQFCKAAQKVSGIRLLMGTFKEDNLVRKEKPMKEKTIRATPRRKKFEDTNATQHETISKDNQKPSSKDGADVRSKSILNALKARHENTSEPVNLVQFAFDKISLARTVENVFCTGFLVRDGFVSLNLKPGTDTVSNLVLKPRKPPKKDEAHNRQQFIWSITPQQWKKIGEKATGDVDIPVSQIRQ